MMNMEGQIKKVVNDIGVGLTESALNKFDTGGEPLKKADTKLTVQQKTVKDYQTPYGRIQISRHIYQSSKGGKTYCPLDSNARIIGACVEALKLTNPPQATSFFNKIKNGSYAKRVGKC